MNQRFTMDRKSFEQFLAAVCLLRQMRTPVQNSTSGKLLVHLLSLQQGIETGSVGLEVAMDRVAALALSIVGASSAAVYFFQQGDQFTCAARAGKPLQEDLVSAEVLAAMARMDEATPDSATRQAMVAPIRTSHYPGWPNSIIVSPLRLDGRIAGAVAAFALNYDAFSQGDRNNINFLAGLIERALLIAVRAGYKKALALEHQAILGIAKQRAWSQATDNPNRRTESEWSAATSLIDEERFHSEDSDEDFEAIEIPSTPADTSIPGIGVRAALGDIQEFTGGNESSRIHTAVSDAARRAGEWVTRRASKLSSAGGRCANAIARTSGRVTVAATGLRTSAGQLRSQVRKEAVARISAVRDYRLPEFAKFLQVAKYWNTCKVGLDSAVSRFGRVGQRFANLSSRTQSQHSTLARKGTLQMRTVWRVRGEFLKTCSRRAQETMDQMGRRVRGVAGSVKVRVSPSLVLSIEKRALRQSAGAILVLSVMVLFLVLNTFVSTPFRPESASASTREHGTAVAENPKVASSSPTPTQLSHLKITDNATADNLHELTRYEVSTLRRTADYADDEAAFQLGMAYETGYFVRQDCKRAAEWVKKAAADGNAAAQYNLGLRYRTGDGVPASEPAAEQWLRRASQQRYAPARTALSDKSTSHGKAGQS